MVFTIPEALRDLFQRERNLIDDLFIAVENTFNYMIKSTYSDKHEYKFGFISTLHSFGRAMNFIPHLHIIIAEALCDKDGKIKPYKHFHYEKMRKSFQKALLDLVKQRLGIKSFKLVNKLYKDYPDGFYVYGPKIEGIDSKNTKEVIKYIIRYAGHPAMSESRIINVDYDNKLITYYFDPHEEDGDEDDKTNKRKYVTESFDDFIAKIIVHIPDDKCHIIRYYGFYANKTKAKPINRLTLFRKSEINEMEKLKKWRFHILKSYGYDMILCECGNIMEIDYSMCYVPTHKMRNIDDG